MTTIVYKDGVIAYDSRATNGDMISSDVIEKKRVVNNVAFFFAGSLVDFDKLVECYFNPETPEEMESDGTCAIVVDNKKVFIVSIDSDSGRFWKQPLELFSKYTIGSGTPYAQAAMEMGADAKKAVQIAMKLDIRTGGKIKTYKIR